MHPIHELLNKIKWDKRENPSEHMIFYFDRILKKLIKNYWNIVIGSDQIISRLVNPSIIKAKRFLFSMPIKPVARHRFCLWMHWRK